MDRKETQLFYIEDGELYYINRPVRDCPISDEAKGILENLVVPEQTPEMFYLSLIFCIASHRQNYERPTRLVRHLLGMFRSSSIHIGNPDPLRDPDIVKNTAVTHGVRWSSVREKNRVYPAFRYIEGYRHGIEGLVEDFKADSVGMRDKLVRDVKWIAHKTASFWYLCLGGEQLMTLDVHNYRQIAGLGVDVPNEFYEAKRRKNGIKELKTASEREYVRIEQETLTLLNGVVSGAMVTTLFWLVGAKMQRGINLYQQDILGKETRLQFSSPYQT